MPFNPFSVLTSKIFGGVSLILLLAVAFLSFSNHNLKKDNAGLHTDLGKKEEQLNTSNASIATLQSKINENNLRIESAAKELQTTRETAAAQEAKLREQYQTTATEVSNLETDARRKDRKPCTVSPAALKALEELSQ